MQIKKFNCLWHWHLLPQSLVAFLEFIHHNSTISSETPRCEDVMIMNLVLNLVNFPMKLPFFYALIHTLIRMSKLAFISIKNVSFLRIICLYSPVFLCTKLNTRRGGGGTSYNGLCIWGDTARNGLLFHVSGI